jgi:hypothetical protein
MKFNIALLVSCLLLAAASSCWGVEVDATGMGFFEAGREAVGREKALNDAKRAAVEKAVGVSVSSATEVRNFMTVRDQVLSRATGYLKNYKILKEGPTPFGSYEVSIRADVMAGALVDDLSRFAKMLSLQKSPRIAVQVRPTVPAEYRSAANKAVSLLNHRLARSGFTVVDPQAVRSGPALILKLGVECSSKDALYEGVKLTSNEVGLSADVVRPESGEVLASASAVATTPGASPLKALDKGVEITVSRIYEQVRSNLARAWSQELNAARDIVLFVEATPNYRDGMQMLQAMRSDVPGVERAELIRYKNGKCRFEIRYKGQPQFFLSELEMSYFQSKYFRFKVKEVSDGVIVLRYSGKGGKVENGS